MKMGPMENNRATGLGHGTSARARAGIGSGAEQKANTTPALCQGPKNHQILRIASNRSKSEHDASAFPRAENHQTLRIASNRSKSEHNACALPRAENHQILRIASNRSKSEHNASALPRAEKPPNTAYSSKSEPLGILDPDRSRSILIYRKRATAGSSHLGFLAPGARMTVVKQTPSNYKYLGGIEGYQDCIFQRLAFSCLDISSK